MTPPLSDIDGDAPDSSGEPFVFRVDGREVPIPGAWRYPEGVYIPTESLPSFQEYLADHSRLLARVRQLERKFEDAIPGRYHEVLKARAFMWRLSNVMDAGPEAMAEWLDDLHYNRPLLEARAEADALASELEDYKSRSAVTAMEEDASEVAEEMDRALMPLLTVALMDPAIASLHIDRNRLLVRLYRRADELFVDANEEIPVLGIRRGELLVNTRILQAEVDAAAASARALQESPRPVESQAVPKSKSI